MNKKRRLLRLAALLFCAYLIWLFIEFMRADQCMDVGGRWISAEMRCEL